MSFSNPNRAIAPLLSCVTLCSLCTAVITSLPAHAANVTAKAAIAPLNAEAIAQRMLTIPSWTLSGQTLRCTYRFDNFVESVEFVNQLVAPAETLGHHPDITIRYNRVLIELTTHDADRLTTLDFDLAEQIQAASDRPCQS